jgi:hypothetical protein
LPYAVMHLNPRRVGLTHPIKHLARSDGSSAIH